VLASLYLQHDLALYPSLFEPLMGLGNLEQGQQRIDDQLELPLLNQAAQCIQRGTHPLAIRKVG
jgi:hypothetical protein